MMNGFQLHMVGLQRIQHGFELLFTEIFKSSILDEVTGLHLLGNVEFISRA